MDHYLLCVNALDAIRVHRAIYANTPKTTRPRIQFIRLCAALWPLAVNGKTAAIEYVRQPLAVDISFAVLRIRLKLD